MIEPAAITQIDASTVAKNKYRCHLGLSTNKSSKELSSTAPESWYLN
jgi:hypothetical protein